MRAPCFACGSLAVDVQPKRQHCSACGFTWLLGVGDVHAVKRPCDSGRREAPKPYRAHPMSLSLRLLAALNGAAVASLAKPFSRAGGSATMPQSVPPR